MECKMTTNQKIAVASVALIAVGGLGIMYLYSRAKARRRAKNIPIQLV